MKEVTNLGAGPIISLADLMQLTRQPVTNQPTEAAE